jgi:PIN domain nuclease of toxin-antitoxin system
MNYLLDTHAFIWLDSDPDKLSAEVAAICQDQTNTLFISIVSVWEMQIKIQLGKLHLQTALGQMVENQLR